MSDHPVFFGFGKNIKEESSPLDFISHHLIGANPDRDDGCWNSREEALQNFALQFRELAYDAKHSFLFVRAVNELAEVSPFEDDVKRYRMIGRFSIAKVKKTVDTPV